MRQSRQNLEMLARVNSGSKDFVVWLKARRAEYHVDVGQQRDDVSLRWAQGRLQELDEQIDLLEKAAGLL